MADDSRHVETAAERESREVAEDAREKEWRQPSFMRELFLGNFRLELIDPFPSEEAERTEFKEFYDRLKEFLAGIDPVSIDAEGEYPQELIQGLARLGAFGMKVPKEYGGLGFNQYEYSKVMELLGSYDGNVCALLSAHQSIGLPQPLKLFGTPEQKSKYLPRCAAGAISAFALTEPEVGSDPAKLRTRAEKTPDGRHYVLNGEKLWCTNGTLAEVIVVMARHPESKKISAFIVETDAPGVEVTHRCYFMGLRALANAVIRFDNVRIPAENLIGKEGQGLKIALVTLNTGRLSLPANAVGMAKVCLERSRRWASERVQWGASVGKHEAIAHKIADMASDLYAMDSISLLASHMADRGGYDIRLEAASAKEWNTVRAWQIVDDTVQIIGGRSYETESSLSNRGEAPISAERIMRDSRINRIFEGSSEIMHLFMAREAVDKHLQVSGAMIDPRKSLGQKLAAFPGIALFYAWWYPTRWIGWGRWPRYSRFGKLAGHMRYVERTSRKLSRQVFHAMIVHGPKLQKKQAFLFRIVDVAMELFAMASSISRAQQQVDERKPEAARAGELVDLFCRGARRRIKAHFKALWSNDDVRKYRTAQKVLREEFDWLEQGRMPEQYDTGKPQVPDFAPGRVEQPR